MIKRAIMLVTITAGCIGAALGADLGKSRAWKTTDSQLGLDMTCISIEMGNAQVLSVHKGGRVLVGDDVGPREYADCIRGLKIARKKKGGVAVFTQEDLDRHRARK